MATCYDTSVLTDTRRFVEPYVVACCDGMISEDYTSTTGPIQKVQRVGFFGNWLIGHSGATTRFLPLRDTLTRARADIERQDREADADWTDLLERAYHMHRNRSIQTQYLAQFGFNSVEEWRSDGPRLFGRAEFRRINEKIEAHDLGIAFLLAGFTKQNNIQILGIDHPGEAQDYTMLGHISIGSGSFLANGWLNATYRIRAPLKECMYRVLQAKFFAESSNYVGTETALLAMNSRGVFTVFSKENMDDLRRSWDRMTKEPPRDLDELVDLHVSEGY